MNIPYFDEVISTTITCDTCSYRFNDILITSQKKPIEYKFIISKVEDLNIRVIRSSTATIDIPELGIKIEPTTMAEAFVSNIEGVLVRVEGAIEQASRFTDDSYKKKRAKKLIQQIDQLKKGEGKATIIIKDPMGNSGILSPEAETRELEPAEIDPISTGVTFIDITKKDSLLDN